MFTTPDFYFTLAFQPQSPKAQKVKGFLAQRHFGFPPSAFQRFGFVFFGRSAVRLVVGCLAVWPN